MIKLIIISSLVLSFSSFAQNLSDAEDANQVPASLEKRANEVGNQPDSLDSDFIPASKEARQKQEVLGGANDPVEEDIGADNDLYTDDDNYGLDVE